MKNLLILAMGLLLSAFTVRADSGLTKVAESDHMWTGVTVSREGRIFVNYPSWGAPNPFKVAEIVDGKEVVYPSAADNERFVCIQSVVIDDRNRLWILDPASPGFRGVVEEGPALYEVDLETNRIVRTYRFSTGAYHPKSYLNDVRIDTRRRMAYMTDSSVGGIVVLDLESGESWRGLDSDCPAVRATMDGIDFRSTGFSKNVTHSDGIELSEDGETLYFCALTSDILHQIPTIMLRDRTLSAADRCGLTSVVTSDNVPTDGMVLHGGKLYMANLPEDGVWEYDLSAGKGRTLPFGTTFRWADSFAKDTEGYIYFTTSQINYPESQRGKYEIFKFKPE